MVKKIARRPEPTIDRPPSRGGRIGGERSQPAHLRFLEKEKSEILAARRQFSLVGLLHPGPVGCNAMQEELANQRAHEKRDDWAGAALVSEGRRIVERQRRTVEKLQSPGRDAAAGKHTLDVFES
jgi:hypothetical protein